MSLLDWDCEEVARRVQTGLDRLSVSFFRRHGARIRRDDLDFHGFEHVELEVAHGGHRLHVRQYAPPRGLDAKPTTGAPLAVEEFTSTFDDRPAAEVPLDVLAGWLATLPVGEAPPERARPAADPANPFAAPTRPASAPMPNPFASERPSAPGANPFAPPSADERRHRALEWLRDDDE